MKNLLVIKIFGTNSVLIGRKRRKKGGRNRELRLCVSSSKKLAYLSSYISYI